jgi:hypothetical protein
VHVEEWIGLDEPERWNAALHGVPHSYWHCRTPCLAASVNTGSPVFLYVAHEQADRVVCPLMERGSSGSRDYTTPIGFSGFAATANGLPTWFPARWSASLRDKGAVCVYLAQHPLYAPAWPDADESAAGTLFVLELDRPPEKWLQGVDENRRRSILSWERAGSPWLRDREQLTSFVLQHHASFMRSVGATAASFYSDAALQLLCSDSQVELVGAADSQGVSTVAGFGSTPWGCELLFHISTRDGRTHTAALMWWAVKHYHGKVPAVNLGGTPRDNDALAAAKRRYRPRELPFRRLKQVLDRRRYVELCAQAALPADDLSGYFPAYRRIDQSRSGGYEPCSPAAATSNQRS